MLDSVHRQAAVIIDIDAHDAGQAEFLREDAAEPDCARWLILRPDIFLLETR